uniref:non-specific serine/threonine protein kinase n=1 Tax=Chromera velia CCMP2878 TaxID=1169474 RepID=A0A0G4FPT8_9ALVE|eukprot:Cvel_18027.t1-p1 / transcript=Cvel_18027.t1 / gene=Cvel_18027 / organism=Chromera_velia_CCMP2878 / gene_product=Calcium-dependent protein kinase 2, putative / transcript_product=Calcium-dependent protein kinase 2, putative / location=Cvel_scaffold1471:28324-32831(+) / protein_length=599 / sequence_SO=supercontig / SO=protein_coding / is_pseudo=false
MPQLNALCTCCEREGRDDRRDDYDAMHSVDVGAAGAKPSAQSSNSTFLGMFNLSWIRCCGPREEKSPKVMDTRTNSMNFNRSNLITEHYLGDSMTIHDRFDITSKSLGAGSYGTVCKGRDKATGLERAIKILRKANIKKPQRVAREIKVLKGMDHPHVVRLYEVIEDQMNIYLVMEMLSGGELFERIKEKRQFSEAAAASTMKQIFSALAYCHERGIIHRDLKPENLMYATQDPKATLKVIDWGFAAKCEASHVFNSTVGTPYYVAPEVLEGRYDHMCDLWSAGVILHILLCGYPPFTGAGNKEILEKVRKGKLEMNPKYWGPSRVSPEARKLVEGLLTKDPAKRVTASQALSYPWVNMGEAAQPMVSFSAHRAAAEGTVKNFLAFHQQNALKKVAITSIAYQLRSTDIGQLHEFFQTLDKDGDGCLTFQEIHEGLNKFQVRLPSNLMDVVEALDTDLSGQIDYTEFIAASLDERVYQSETACRAAFQAFDRNGDGQITKEELKQVLATMKGGDASTAASSCSKKSCKDTKCNTHGLSAPAIEGDLSDQEVEEFLRQVDKNGDGCIDIDEFTEMMRSEVVKKSGLDKGSLDPRSVRLAH